MFHCVDFGCPGVQPAELRKQLLQMNVSNMCRAVTSNRTRMEIDLLFLFFVFSHFLRLPFHATIGCGNIWRSSFLPPALVPRQQREPLPVNREAGNRAGIRRRLSCRCDVFSF